MQPPDSDQYHIQLPWKTARHVYSSTISYLSIWHQSSCVSSRQNRSRSIYELFQYGKIVPWKTRLSDVVSQFPTVSCNNFSEVRISEDGSRICEFCSWETGTCTFVRIWGKVCKIIKCILANMEGPIGESLQQYGEKTNYKDLIFRRGFFNIKTLGAKMIFDYLLL